MRNWPACCARLPIDGVTWRSCSNHAVLYLLTPLSRRKHSQMRKRGQQIDVAFAASVAAVLLLHQRKPSRSPDFYRGTTLAQLIAMGPRRSTTSSPAVSRVLRRHLPRAMPLTCRRTARRRHLRATRSYRVAPKDGTCPAVCQTLALATAMTNTARRFDVTKSTISSTRRPPTRQPRRDTAHDPA